MKIRLNIVVFFLMTTAIWGFAQDTDKDEILEAIIEAQVENYGEETDVIQVLEDLEQLLENPININATNSEELSKTYLLNPVQIESLLKYIRDFGPVYSIYELNSIDGFNRELLEKLLLLIHFGPTGKEAESFSESIQYARQQLLLRTLGTLQKSRGYLSDEDGETPYEGNRYRYYSRYNLQVARRFSAGFTAEKDPGEAFFAGPNKMGFDFYSAHASMNFNGILKQVTVGDFIVRSGQGLVLWQGFTTGKSVYTLKTLRTAQGIRPHTSVDENNFFRGIATVFTWKNASLSVFGSQKNSDANISFSDNDLEEFTSLQSSGYHRTKNEIDDKKSVGRTTAGVVAGYSFDYLKIGATFVYDRFNMPFAPGNQLYQKYLFSGTENHTGGINYLFSKGKYLLFGEAARSKSKGNAVLQGATANITDLLGFSILFRHFDKDYQALWGNTFSEGSNVANESGLYFGTRILPAKHITINVYSDFYRSEWLNFSTAGPAQGWDIFAQATVYFSENFKCYLRFKNEEKEQKTKSPERYINQVEKIQRLRFHMQYKPISFITFKTRVEGSFYTDGDKETGFMFFQDIGFEPEKTNMKAIARIALFSTDSYNSRIYAYENDLAYTFSVPALYGKGIRTYLNLRYKITQNIDLWFKMANTHWSDRSTINSGYNEITGNNKTELKLQVRLKI